MGNVNSSPVTVMNSPLDLGEASFIPANGWVSGWAINNVQMSYNTTNDTMYVGLAGFKNASGQYAIFGDADGNGDPGGASTQMTAMGGIDSANMGGDKAVAVAFAPFNSTNPDRSGAPTMIAGIPVGQEPGRQRDRRVHRREVQHQHEPVAKQLRARLSAASAGNLAFNPSAAPPRARILDLEPEQERNQPHARASGSRLYAGSGQDVVAGEAGLVWTYVPPLRAPADSRASDLLVWAGLAGGLAWRYRRSRRTPRLTSRSVALFDSINASLRKMADVP